MAGSGRGHWDLTLGDCSLSTLPHTCQCMRVPHPLRFRRWCTLTSAPTPMLGWRSRVRCAPAVVSHFFSAPANKVTPPGCSRCLRVNVNVNELRLGFSNTTRNPEGILSHNNRRDTDESACAHVHVTCALSARVPLCLPRTPPPEVNNAHLALLDAERRSKVQAIIDESTRFAEKEHKKKVRAGKGEGGRGGQSWG
jgi:hypothetical protein